MSSTTEDGLAAAAPAGDLEPGGVGTTRNRFRTGLRSYLLGLSLAAALTIASFWAAGTGLVYAPGIPMLLAALAIAQMGIHLVFFLHITTDPDNTNNALALAFGVLIVFLVITGSLWIMSHLNHAMMPMSQMMKMQR